VGPIDERALSLPNGKEVFSERTSFFFKQSKVVRMVDKKRRTLVYLVYSTKLIEGSPFNAISSVPIMPWQAQ
jgi:CreA protein